MIEFEPFPKIARLSREVIISEKIDGTNAQILIGQWRDFDEEFVINHNLVNNQVIDGHDFFLVAGSRNRYLTLDNDNYGFAKWCNNNWEELIKLGPGRHFGEWWGQGIQRGYGLKEKRFSLFNTTRWSDDNIRPACCHVVPTIYRGIWYTGCERDAMDAVLYSSIAAPGYTNPEGIVLYHTHANVLFKKTFEKDATGKDA